MSRIEAIEHEIERLSPMELAAFRNWFREFDAKDWDMQLEEDANAGKLDAIADAALKAFESGRATEL